MRRILKKAVKVAAMPVSAAVVMTEWTVVLLALYVHILIYNMVGFSFKS